MFWDNFSDLCKKNNVTPNGLAKILSISSGSITSWKQGRVPKWKTLTMLADYFGVTVEELISEQKEKPLEELKEPDEKDTEILAMYSRLSDEQKKQALSYLEYLAQHKASEDTQ